LRPRCRKSSPCRTCVNTNAICDSDIASRMLLPMDEMEAGNGPSARVARHCDAAALQLRLLERCWPRGGPDPRREIRSCREAGR
jgi:hypothetical protein